MTFNPSAHLILIEGERNWETTTLLLLKDSLPDRDAVSKQNGE